MKVIYLLLTALFISLLFSCSSPKQYFDDGVRIKSEKHNDPKYTTVPGTDKKRSSSTLRGTVYRIETVSEGCGNNDSNATVSSYVIFRDSTDNAKLERIPIEDVILVGIMDKVNLDTNYFEYYNDPLDPRAIREVPHKYPYIDTCAAPPCDCGQLDLGIDCPTSFKCRDTVVKKRWWFMELRGGYAIYNDREPGSLFDIAQEAYFGEYATGFRFGNRHQYGLGFLVSSGVPIFNSQDMPDYLEGTIPDAIYRPLVMLHGRYQFENIFCLRPFMYGDFGMSLDRLTLDLACININDCQDCKDIANQYDADVDISMPLSYGFGAGVDIPVTCDFDISLDLGWRSVAFGEKSPNSLFGLTVPNKRRVNMFIFRVGVTL